MPMKLLSGYLLLFTFLLSSCGHKAGTAVEHDSTNISKEQNGVIKLHKLKKLFVVGDFDGDAQPDTLAEHYISKLTGEEIDSAADPFQNEWETVVKWFYHQQVRVLLKFHKSSMDTLPLGTAHGLYCLINIGDINEDRIDEIAFVVDQLDVSHLNSCAIYSLCGEKWVELKQFEIHESAFEFVGDTPPVFNDIKEYLEFQNGKWFYRDYPLSENESGEEIKMTVLTLKKCP
jgi:hypothetical protein